MSAKLQDPISQQVFTALADPTRRSILELLANNGGMAATDIYNEFTVSPPAISQHLKVLREADLVHLEKEAQRHIYSLNPATMTKLETWIRQTTEHWNERFDQLDRVLETEKKRLKKRGGD